jgi:hypothetical protein
VSLPCHDALPRMGGRDAPARAMHRGHGMERDTTTMQSSSRGDQSVWLPALVGVAVQLAVYLQPADNADGPVRSR